MTNKRSFLRAGVLTGLVSVLSFAAPAVHADVRTIETVTGTCHYTAGTVEGGAVAVHPGARQTGIVCNVYENGKHIGGCSGGLNGPTAACIGPVVGVGPPVVCTYAYALYGDDTMVTDEHCE